MKQSKDILNDLVSATRDGIGFYEHAASKVKNPELKALFLRLANVKADIVQDLAFEIRAGGDKPTESGTWSGDFHRFYGEMRPHVSDKNYAYVAQLEESEDQLLKAFDRALNDEDISPHAHTVITRLLPEVRSCHDIMRTQKIALKKAA
ncbi:MAG TPA: PA2169 family four-helix-bundle protein [Xanthomonadaceae bacterium]|nr:PA2169 family four-helix-bundle protein [Xanthomonadaceae bacterium]